MSHEDDYPDYEQQEALENLFRQHTQEFKNDLAYAALLNTGSQVEVVRELLTETRKVIAISPSAGLVFAASASEITLRDLFFVPILSGLIHEEFGVSIIVKLLTRITRDKIARPLTALLKRGTFIDLDEEKRTPESLSILVEASKIAEKRNGILHKGEFVDEASAQDALAVAEYLLNNTFQNLLALHKLRMLPEERDGEGRTWKTIAPLFLPSEEDQDPWQ